MGEVLAVNLWDVRRTAEFFGKSETWVYRARRKLGLPCVKVGRDLRFVPAMIQRWLEQHGGNSDLR